MNGSVPVRIYLYNKQRRLATWVVDHLLILRDFGPYEIIFMNVCVVITVAMVWWSFVVKGFWALWDSTITVAMVMLLKVAYYVELL
jgi:hypothetical protein